MEVHFYSQAVIGHSSVVPALNQEEMQQMKKSSEMLH